GGDVEAVVPVVAILRKIDGLRRHGIFRHPFEGGDDVPSLVQHVLLHAAAGAVHTPANPGSMRAIIRKARITIRTRATPTTAAPTRKDRLGRFGSAGC